MIIFHAILAAILALLGAIDEPAEANAPAERLPPAHAIVEVAPPPVPDAPLADRPPCPGARTVYLLDALYDYPTCDLNPPQVLGARLRPGQVEACYNSGGVTLWDPMTMTSYCLGIDY